MIEKPIAAFVYPNPVKDQFTVQLKEDVMVKGAVLVNSSGKAVWSKQYNALLRTFKVNAVQYPNGIYYLKINTAKEVLTERILVARN